MSSNDGITQLEAQLQRACVLKVERKATAEHKVAEEYCLAEEKAAAVEECHLTEEKEVAEVEGGGN